MLTLALIVFAPGCAPPPTETMDVGEVRLRFDPRRISRERLDELAALSPHRDSGFLPPSLELCVEGDAAYRSCGSRKLDAPDFIYNAEVNIAKGRATLRRLDELDAPRELEPAREYARRSLTFYSCIYSAELAYYRGDNNALEVVCGGVDARAACSDAVAAARKAEGPAARHDAASYTWGNCMNNAFRSRLGDYPAEYWMRFRAAFGIEEELIDPEAAAPNLPADAVVYSSGDAAASQIRWRSS